MGFAGETDVKYADAGSWGEGMTMLVSLSGRQDAATSPPSMIFTTRNGNHPIRGVLDNITRVVYRTGAKGRMDTTILPEWLTEARMITGLPNNRTRSIFVDNCSRHNGTEKMRMAVTALKKKIFYFPPNATHLLQPCDRFIIQKIKIACTKH